MSKTTKPLQIGISICLGALIVLPVFTWHNRRQPSPTTGSTASAMVVNNPGSTESAPRTKQENSPWEPMVAQLRSSKTPATAQDQLRRIREELRTLSRDEASARIRAFLDSKVDATTHLPFKIGANGFLTEAPTLRVFLLDYLAQIDPAAAAAYARSILSAMESPDEWAVALRNYAKGMPDSEGRLFLEQKFQALLTNVLWRRDPSVGFLEAFDVAVHLGGTGFVPTLAESVRAKDNQAVAHAAFLTLDRLVIGQPTEVLAVLEQNPATMEGREQTRANYFARADVGDPTQREVLERYLLDPTRPAVELQSFAGLFPNANYMISQNLLTSNVTPDGATLARRDRDALRVVGEWLADPRFAGLQPQLLKIQQRLQDFASQTDSNR